MPIRGRMPLLRISSPNREFDLFVSENKAPDELLVVLGGTAVDLTQLIAGVRYGTAGSIYAQRRLTHRDYPDQYRG